jgi:hypothetical protein
MSGNVKGRQKREGQRNAKKHIVCNNQKKRKEKIVLSW